jgi:hypothetical protein
LVARSPSTYGADRIHEGDAEGLDARHAAALVGRRDLVDRRIVEPARRRAVRGGLRRGRRQRVELPACLETAFADLALERQEAARRTTDAASRTRA